MQKKLEKITNMAVTKKPLTRIMSFSGKYEMRNFRNGKFQEPLGGL